MTWPFGSAVQATEFPNLCSSGARMNAKVPMPVSCDGGASPEKTMARRVDEYSTTSSQPALAIMVPAKQKYDSGTLFPAIEAMRPAASGAVHMT